MVVQGDVRLAAGQAVVPEKVKERWVFTQAEAPPPQPPPLLGRELLASPQEEGHVALLALPALHGAVQGGAGVSKGKVVELAVRVGGAAFISLKTGGGTNQHPGTFEKKPPTSSKCATK